jgi:hypothetical protein
MRHLNLLCTALLLAQLAYGQQLRSPNERFTLQFSLVDGAPTYQLQLDEELLIAPSRLGLELVGAPAFTSGFLIAEVTRSTVDETWEPVWGETKTIRNHYNEMAVMLEQENTDRSLLIRFRLFDDGLGFLDSW